MSSVVAVGGGESTYFFPCAASPVPVLGTLSIPRRCALADRFFQFAPKSSTRIDRKAAGKSACSSGTGALFFRRKRLRRDRNQQAKKCAPLSPPPDSDLFLLISISAHGEPSSRATLLNWEGKRRGNGGLERQRSLLPLERRMLLLAFAAATAPLSLLSLMLQQFEKSLSLTPPTPPR